MRYVGKTNEFFQVTQSYDAQKDHLQCQGTAHLLLIWFRSDNNELKIDNEIHTFHTNDIICLTEFSHLEILKLTDARVLQWNKEFYCILDHDSEVSCRGMLFYGAANLPHMKASGEELEVLDVVWQMLLKEMVSNDTLQEEMLRMMLKRILILCTRIYKKQKDLSQLPAPSYDLVREYNFLVEKHFREKHTVNEYAELLNKSPKTLSNLFRKAGNKTPLQYIKDRKMLEARRLLTYTDKTVSEIGYELGFADVQSFSRFFKKEEGSSPLQYAQKSTREK